MYTTRAHYGAHRAAPLFQTVEQMSRSSGISATRLRSLMDRHEIEYIQNGSRHLLTERAVWDWYERNKVPVCTGPAHMYAIQPQRGRQRARRRELPGRPPRTVRISACAQ